MTNISDKELARVYPKHVKLSDAAKRKKKWIQKAISRPGALHRALGVPEGKKIPAGKLTIKATDSPRVKRMKLLAKTLKKLPKRRK